MKSFRLLFFPESRDYCSGVTSGILMAEYLKKHFPVEKGGYFIHTVDPWCREDALLVLLNATPNKRSYAVSYPNKGFNVIYFLYKNKKATNPLV
ncbi:MAG: FmdE family protein [Desulfobacterales bacterium]